MDGHGASCHVCSCHVCSKELFIKYVPTPEKVSMANKTQAEVLRTRIVVLKLTSEKFLTLQDMKHVSVIAKNLVSGSLLCRADFRMDINASQIVMSYKGTYFGKHFVPKGCSNCSL